MAARPDNTHLLHNERRLVILFKPWAATVLGMAKFNSTFYATAATVIPVLYLALTLQGSTHRDLMSRWRKTNQESPMQLRSQIRVVALTVVAIAAGYVIIFGIIGEYSALQALSAERTGPNTRSNVYDSCIWLLIMVGVVPVLQFSNAFFGTLADDRRAAMKRRKARLERAGAAQKPDPESEAS
jgi:hypothetical protein